MNVDGNWLFPGTPRAPWLKTYTGWATVDPKTLKISLPPVPFGGRVIANGGGYVVTKEDGGLEGRGRSGKVRWRLPSVDYLGTVGIIGKYLYAQLGIAPQPEWRVLVINVKTGRKVGTVDGRLTLSAGERGRSYGQVPGIDGGQSYYDAD